MSLLQKNTRKQGDAGLGQAIAYFTSLGYSVSLPLTESQRYDLIVDDGESLNRVEVKTTRNKKSDAASFVVQLATNGGNQTWNGTIRKISKLDSDYVFVVTSDGSRYLIPTELLDGKQNVTLTSKWDEFKI
jgi:hypothetical protein